jgi:hypothetical protein
MGLSSYAPLPMHDDDRDDAPTVRPRPMLRLSRMPSAHAVITLTPVDQTFSQLGIAPTGPAENDALTEDELFAIWQARLL